MNKIKKKIVLQDYEEHLHEELKDDELVIHYINEAACDPDPRVFILALKDVLKSRGHDVSAITNDFNLSWNEIIQYLNMLNIKTDFRWAKE